MIEFVQRDGPPEAMLCPALVCDACRKQVTKAGNVLWADRYENGARQVSPLFVAHKGRCDQAVTRWMNETYREADGWRPGHWEEARAFLEMLTHNFAHPFSDDTEGRYQDHRLALPTSAPRVKAEGPGS